MVNRGAWWFVEASEEGPAMAYRGIAWSGALLALVWLAGVGPGGAANEKVPGDDREFLTEAASGGQMEVALGRAAIRNASHKRVREFGQRMVTDHRKANAELRQIAAKKDVRLPAEPVDDDHRKTVAELSQLKGADFDRAYMQAMVDDHEDDVEKFRAQAKESKDPDVKSFAAKALPTLEAHLRMAKEVASEVHATTSGAGKHRP
jgi:putative membrane protein